MYKTYQCAAVVAAALLFVARIASADLDYSSRVKEHQLANGMKVLLLEDHKAGVSTFQVWYRVGSRNEELGKTGLSHLLEHLMFKGTEKHGPEEYSRIIQRNGGNENAFTANDNTAYFANIASDRLPVLIELEADRMHNLSFDDAHFGPELQVVIEERRLRTEDNPTAALFESLSATAFTAHPYEWPVIGWMGDLRQATREDALAHYRLYYAPANAFIVSVGDFNSDELLKEIEAQFGSIPAGQQAPAVRAVEPPQQGERRLSLRREAQLPFVAMAYHVPNLKDADAPALEVLSAVLAGGESTRLHKRLVYEQRIAREAGTDYQYTSADPNLFIVHGQPLPGKTAAAVEKSLLVEVELIKTAKGAVTAAELQKAKQGIEAGFVLAQDSQFYKAMMLAQYEIAGGWKQIDEYLPRVRAVTADDVARVAQKYLTTENRTVGVLDPLPPSKDRPLPPAAPPMGRLH